MKRPFLRSTFELEVNAYVNVSESSTKVINAVTSIISHCSPELKYGNQVIGKSVNANSLEIIYEQIRSRSAQNVFRRILIWNRNKNTTWFFSFLLYLIILIFSIFCNSFSLPLIQRMSVKIYSYA
jgi:hypothetical protein